MDRRTRLALLALTVGTPTAAVISATPASATACPSGTGVTVVVGSSVSCAPGDPSTALQALQSAGHGTTMVQRYPGALCRIDGAPASDPCVMMPPASAYWAFYTAKRGGSWSYADVGVTGWNPAPGTVVGFAFGAGAQPGVAPPAAAAPRPSTTSRTSTAPAAPRTTTRSSAPAAGQAPAPAPRSTTRSTHAPATRTDAAGTPGRTADSPTSAAASTSTPASRTSRPTSTSRTRTPSSTTARSTPAPSATSAATPSTPGAVEATGSSHDSAPTSALVGLGLIAVLAAVAGTIAWRRRQVG